MIPAPWTKEQWEAIRARDCDLLVSAAAGAGKTAVLVERVFRLITDPAQPVDLNQLLVVTFTEAAAREMKERIGQKLSEALQQYPEDQRIALQLTLLDSASISTIHAFCLSLLRRYFYELDLDPAFRVLDEAEAVLLRRDIIEELFNRRYQEGDPGFIAVVDSFGGFDTDGALKGLILALYDFSVSLPDPQGWLDQALGNFHNPQFWQDMACDQVARELFCLMEDYRYVEGLCRAHGEEAYANLLATEMTMFSGLEERARSRDWTGLQRSIGDASFARLPRVKDPVEEVKSEVQRVRDDAKKIIDAVRTTYLRPAGLGEELARCHEQMSVVVDLVKEFGRDYRLEKLRQGKVDFSDLEHYALELLERPQVQEDLAGRYRYVLVDEYQDINGVQEVILNRCAPEADMFFVGDIKQSIYRFRLADPGLFLEKYQRFTPAGPKEKRVNLRVNFRCHRNIVAGVNYIFRQLFSKEVGELEYDEQAELVCGREESPVEGSCQFHLVEGELEEELSQPGLEAVHREALVMAAQIREIVGKVPVYDKRQKCVRPAAYSDIVILLRAMGKSDRILEVFERCGIPAYVELGEGYFGATEVQTILSLLKVIDNPRQDIPLVAVLRSPIVGLSPEELAKLRLTVRDGDFYDCLLQNSTQPKVARFLAQLAEFRDMARRCPLSQLIWGIYRKTGYYDYVIGLPGGAQRRANLRALYSRALQFEEFSRQGLLRFLEFIAELQRSGEDMAPASTVGEKDDVVRIMSVHKSKGLEFPIVFVAGLGNEFNLRDLRADILWSKELGLGPVLADLENRYRYSSLPRALLRQQKHALSLSEELRILYVALTRARDHLILVGTVKDLAESVARWSRVLGSSQWKLPVSMRIRARSYLDWLGPALIRHGDSRELQRLAGTTQGTALADDTQSQWQVKWWQGEELVLLEEQVTAQQLDLTGGEDQSLWEQIEDVLNWEYDHIPVVGIPAKVTVTEVTKQAASEESESWLARAGLQYPRRPVFMQRQGLTGAEFGTAMHRVLQHLRFQDPMDAGWIAQELVRLVERELLTPQEAGAIDVEALVSVFATDVGKRLLKALRVERELAFTCQLPAGTLLGGSVEEFIVLQGVVDCLFLDRFSQQWVLVDFKTDQPETIPRRRKIYQRQVELYREALKLQNWHVAEGYLCFLSVREWQRVY